MTALAKVLGLLTAGDEPASEGESFLAASILHSGQPLEPKLVEVLSSRAGKDDLGLWVQMINACPALTVAHNFTNWTQMLTQTLQTTTDPNTLGMAFRALQTLLHSVSNSSQALGKLSLALPPLLQCLLHFSPTSTPPPLQTMALGLLAHCLVHFTSSCSQYRPALKKWVAATVFHSDLSLSQESSRVFVLLCHHSNQKWSSMVASVLYAVEWVLQQLHKHSNSPNSGGFPSSTTAWMTLPTLPTTDPQRTGVLTQLLTQLTRTLCYSLLFPPCDPTHPPSVPLPSVLAVVSEGLRPATTGHTVEALVLQVTMPVVHTAMWNVLCVLIQTCHTHLLPYGPHVKWLLVTALCSKDTSQSRRLLDAVHRTLATWVGVARDYDASFMTPVFHSLLQSCDHTPLRPSSLKTLGTLVSFIGPLLTTPHAALTLRLPMEGLTPSLPPSEALALLHILKACISSGNRHLTPPTSAAVQLLSDLAKHHMDSEVITVCQSCLSLHTYTSPQATPTTSTTQSRVLAPPLEAPPTSLAPPTPLAPAPQASNTLVTSVTPPMQNQRKTKRTRSKEPEVESGSKKRSKGGGGQDVGGASSGKGEGWTVVSEAFVGEDELVVDGGSPEGVAVDGGSPGGVAVGGGSPGGVAVDGGSPEGVAVDGGSPGGVAVGGGSPGGVAVGGESPGGVAGSRDSVEGDNSASDDEASGMEYFVPDSD